MINLELTNAITNLNTDLTRLSNILYNCSLLMYQNIIQKSITYPPFENATVDYNYVPPNLEYSVLFGLNQIQAVMTFYVDNVNEVITRIKATGYESQLTNKLNEVNQSVSQLNDFAVSLYEGQKNNIRTYTTPFPMSIRYALITNGFSLKNLNLVILYNLSTLTIYSLNYIPQNTTLLLL